MRSLKKHFSFSFQQQIVLTHSHRIEKYFKTRSTIKSKFNNFSFFNEAGSIDTLLPLLDTLTTKVGSKSAIRLLSTDSFCAGIDYLLPLLDSLTTKVGSKSAIRLLASGGFCANISIVLPALDILIGKLDKDNAVSILASDSFCKRIENLLPIITELQPRFGNKGLKAITIFLQ